MKNYKSLYDIEKEINRYSESENESQIGSGKIFVSNNVPAKNGRIILLRQRITPASVQLVFQLPDDEEHAVFIEEYDSTGIINTTRFSGLDQFQFQLFPYSPESQVRLRIYLEDTCVCERVIRIPLCLRAKDYVRTPIVESRKQIDEMPLETITAVPEEVKEISLDMNIDMRGISEKAISMMKG